MESRCSRVLGKFATLQCSPLSAFSASFIHAILHLFLFKFAVVLDSHLVAARCYCAHLHRTKATRAIVAENNTGRKVRRNGFTEPRSIANLLIIVIFSSPVEHIPGTITYRSCVGQLLFSTFHWAENLK